MQSALGRDDYEGAVEVNVTVSDNGNTGTPGALGTSGAFVIDVINVPDVTTLAALDTSFTEGGTITGNTLIKVTMTGVSDRVVVATCTASAGTAVVGTGDNQDYVDGSEFGAMMGKGGLAFFSC